MLDTAIWAGDECTAARCESCHRPLRRSPGPLGPVCARRENPGATSHRFPVVPRRRVSAIPGQIPLDLDEPQENP